jgi:drug/metabolite transporter (DMT)-like permease
VLLFIVLFYALVVLAPHSALHDSMAETLAGGATVAVAVALLVLRRLPKRRWSLERSIYAVFLAAMPCIYLATALKRGSSSDIAIELVGMALFVGLAVFVTTNRF